MKVWRDSIRQADSESDQSEDNDEEEDEKKNSQLLQSLSTLSRKKRNKETLRTEASQVVSDFHMSEGDGKIKVHELLKTLSSSSKLSISKKLLKSAARKTKLLNVPLPKPQAEKIKRRLAYEKTSKEVSKWDSVVNKNRTAECLEFPLNQAVITMEPTVSLVKRFKAKTPLELEVDRLLSGSDNVHNECQALTPAEERALKAMSLEEARERLRELQKMRALLSYQEARARRQNKIKSKKYHRILKKDRLKKQLAEFEMLKSENPEGALEKLQELDKRRIEERLTLKHKNTGKWAKQNALRSKYDKQARDALSEQLELNKQLTKKVVPVSSDEESEPEEAVEPNDETEEKEEAQEVSLPANYNAWLRSDFTLPAPVPPETPRTVSIKPKPRTKVVVIPDTFKKADPQVTEHSSNVTEEPEILCETISLTPPDKTSDKVLPLEPTESNGQAKRAPVNEKKEKAEEVLVDPTKFIGAKPKVLLSKAPDLIESDEEGGNDDNSAHLTMREAFADDDVLEEFKNAKEDAVQAGKPKDIDLFLPGWGDWGGSGIVPSKRKRKRFLIKAAPCAPRQDRKLGNVIINEEKETHITKHLVSELPFPFKTVQQFETSVSHPVGCTWNTQSSFQDLTRPDVIVRKGQIIEPMSSEEILKHQARQLITKKQKK